MMRRVLWGATMTVGLIVEFTDEDDGASLSTLDEVERAYMVMVGAAHAADGLLDLDEFMALARSAYEAVNEAPAGTVLQ